MTQAELAKALGVGQYVITKWENGVHNPSPSDLTAIAKSLAVPISRLFGQEQEVPASQVPPPPTPKTRAAQIQKVFEQLKPADQRALLKHAKGLISGASKAKP